MVAVTVMDMLMVGVIMLVDVLAMGAMTCLLHTIDPANGSRGVWCCGTAPFDTNGFEFIQ